METETVAHGNPTIDPNWDSTNIAGPKFMYISLDNKFVKNN